MRYLLIILLFACGGNPKQNNGKPGNVSVKPKPAPVVIIPKAEPAVNWQDRRPVGMLMLANWKPSAEAPNYRNWFLQGSYYFEDLKTAAIEHINESIKNLKYLDAQGVVFWDIDGGQKYPHSITYTGSPDMISVLAPEMDSIADTLFMMVKNAGFRTGVCLRPTVIKNLDSWPGQFNEDSYSVLDRKVTYAKNRWGCTLFYVDSNVGDELGKVDNTVGAGQPTPVSVFQRLSAKHPDCLFIPEWQTDEYYKYTAPFNDLNYGYLIDDNIRSKVTGAFMVLKVADYSLNVEQIRQSINQGNIMLFRPWYSAPEIELIKEAYENLK